MLVMSVAEQFGPPQGFSEEFLAILTMFGWASAADEFRQTKCGCTGIAVKTCVHLILKIIFKLVADLEASEEPHSVCTSHNVVE